MDSKDKNIEVVEINGKNIILKLNEFEDGIDMNELTKIDYDNILGEILTVSNLLNKVAILKSQLENEVAEAKLAIEITSARLSNEYRNDLIETITDEKGKKKTSKPTQSEVENAVSTDEEYAKVKREYFVKQKNLSYIEGLYWACQDKSKKLEKISDKMMPEEFSGSILEGSINSVLIKIRDKK